MNAIDSGMRRHRCLRVLPRPRGSWIVVSDREVLSEHSTATEAENAAWARLGDGDELLVIDRYHRCHRRIRPGRIRPTSGRRISRHG
jgi:hypothetical protein